MTWELSEDPIASRCCRPLTPVKCEFELPTELRIIFSRHEFSKINLLNMNC